MSVTDAPVLPRPTAGVDWASTDHAVAIVDHEGERIGRFSVPTRRPGCAPWSASSPPMSLQ